MYSNVLSLVLHTNPHWYADGKFKFVCSQLICWSFSCDNGVDPLLHVTSPETVICARPTDIGIAGGVGYGASR